MPSDRVERWRGEDFQVRPVAASSSGRSFRCPGCHQMMPATLPHVVAWRYDDFEATDRRHWHTACWKARDSRSPVVERSRNAPRYG